MYDKVLNTVAGGEKTFVDAEEEIFQFSHVDVGKWVGEKCLPMLHSRSSSRAPEARGDPAFIFSGWPRRSAPRQDGVSS
jgi:hypothetical protein